MGAVAPGFAAVIVRRAQKDLSLHVPRRGEPRRFRATEVAQPWGRIAGRGPRWAPGPRRSELGDGSRTAGGPPRPRGTAPRAGRRPAPGSPWQTRPGRAR